MVWAEKMRLMWYCLFMQFPEPRKVASIRIVGDVVATSSTRKAAVPCVDGAVSPLSVK